MTTGSMFARSLMLSCVLGALPAVAQEPPVPAGEAPPPAAPPAPPPAPTPPPAPISEAPPSRETACDNGIDDDGDTVSDCADADCKGEARCKPDGKPENSEEKCSDWLDNDGDGATDCDDAECTRPGIAYCQGSWVGSPDGDGETASSRATEGGNAPAGTKFAPEVEMADSNDGVGFVGVRFGVVAGVLQSVDYNNTRDPAEYDTTLDTRVNLLQLRAFGSLPLLEDSFFLINLRGERSPRLTFAMFQVPIGGGHYVNVNTGGGSLSNALIISAAKQPLLEAPFYMVSAFEQGNGAALEIHGPIIPGTLRYRTYFGGGAGFSTGNIGGRRFAFDNFNYTYTVGAQLQAVPIGFYNRFDSPFLYKPVPLALGLNIGAKYDQRQQERYPAVNASAVFRWGHFELMVEDYVKTELNFGAVQNAYNITVGVLLIPEYLFAAADFGQFWTSGFGEVSNLTGGLVQVLPPPEELETELRRQRGETQARIALHWYFWRNNGILSVRYAGRFLDPPKVGNDSDRAEQFVSHETWLAAQFRF